MRRRSRHCTDCMGCDDCWICRHSYPNSIIMSPLSSPHCCPEMIGTFGVLPWGNAATSFGSLFHRSFGNQGVVPAYSGGKPICMAYWSFTCTPFDAPNILNWQVYLFVGTLNPFIGSLAGLRNIAALTASTRIDAFVELRHTTQFGVPISGRTERYQIDLPKPCPVSGVFELAPFGTVTTFGADPFTGSSCPSGTGHSLKFEVEIVADDCL